MADAEIVSSTDSSETDSEEPSDIGSPDEGHRESISLANEIESKVMYHDLECQNRTAVAVCV